ncbi:MAG: lipid-A-disaccharide synthase [Polyangiales bacterium]
MAERILVVAGEPSGDRTLASVVRAMGVPSVGIGGDALAHAGTELVAHVRDVSGMGAVELGSRARAILRGLSRLREVVEREKPRLALLASWSAANARIGARLRKRGTRVIWISPPEVWAWMPTRAESLAKSADRMIVTLPFEENLWPNATYLGHPALDDRVSHPSRKGLAVLPGSRPGEIHRLLEPFLDAAKRSEMESRVIVAPSLSPELRDTIRRAADRSRIETIDASPEQGAAALLGAYEVALVASGTASLEAAIAGTPPVVAYRMHPVTMAIAKRLVKIPYFALPNVVLERAGCDAPFRERVQNDVNGPELARAIAETMADRRSVPSCNAVLRVLDKKLPGTFGERVAAAVRTG